MKKAIKNTTIADRCLFLFLLIGSFAGLIYTKEAFSHGSEVVIELDGKPAYSFPLSDNRTVSLDTARGHAVIEINEGRVRMKEARCDNQTCVKQGWISGGSIICLPGNIVIMVGGGQKKRIDAVTG